MAGVRHVLAIVLSVAAVPATAKNGDPVSLAAEEQAAIRAAVAQVADSVVQIRTIGGFEQVDQTLLPDGPTTGLVISADGWILSSAFNFVQQPTSILVTFADGEQSPAELVARDQSRKLVLLKAQGVSGLATPEFVPADSMHVGQWAIAVGRTFRADRPNISVGIVSALGRMFGKAIQTDADVSTANYGGPLVDIRGRVYGVIVPMSPQATSELAGAEWYDSGIGFAVPLAGLDAAIERMKRGEDQQSGVLGIGMAATNPHESPAELVTVVPSSPAGKAGLKKGDKIIELDGRPIATQSDLRFALGPLYSGDEVRVTAARGDERLERVIELTGELEPFRHAFLGILPLRTDTKPAADEQEPGEGEESKPTTGIAVRMIYPGSPAAEAGMSAGDRLLKIDESPIDSVASAIRAMNSVIPGADVRISFEHDGKAREATLSAARLPTTVPAELPRAIAEGAAPDDSEIEQVKPSELKLAEFKQTCRVYVPPSHESRPAGVLLWLHAPGEPPTDELFEAWRAICGRDGLILVAPASEDPSRWDRTELEYLRRLTERVIADYRVDPNRVVVYGHEGGGAMAYLLALAGRQVFSGVATSAATLPRTVNPPHAEPATRLAVFAGMPSAGDRLAQIRSGLKKLADAGYPVTAETLAAPDGSLSAEEREELARWIDTLDRF